MRRGSENRFSCTFKIIKMNRKIAYVIPEFSLFPQVYSFVLDFTKSRLRRLPLLLILLLYAQIAYFDIIKIDFYWARRVFPSAP